jgi:plasmid stabilization system protein ParE
MSSPKPSLTLAPEAQDDLVNILRYTGERWGQEQLMLYRSKLDDALLMIGCHPQIGHREATLPDTHRLYLLVPTSSSTEFRKMGFRLSGFCISE